MRLTWMSMTKITVENWARGTSRVSSVTSPGQSHISSGMTVLRGAARWRQGRRGRLGEVQTHSKWCLVDCVVVSRYRVSRGGRLLNRTCWIEVFPLLGIAGEEACTRLGTGTSRSRWLAHTLFRPTWHTLPHTLWHAPAHPQQENLRPRDIIGLGTVCAKAWLSGLS